MTDAGLAHFQSAYPGESLSKDDLCYYVYGILHPRTTANALPTI
ncbi:type ISP restriction/modification enzyme [Pseudomonas aeruginosa]